MPGWLRPRQGCGSKSENGPCPWSTWKVWPSSFPWWVRLEVAAKKSTNLWETYSIDTKSSDLGENVRPFLLLAFPANMAKQRLSELLHRWPNTLDRNTLFVHKKLLKVYQTCLENACTHNHVIYIYKVFHLSGILPRISADFTGPVWWGTRPRTAVILAPRAHPRCSQKPNGTACLPPQKTTWKSLEQTQAWEPRVSIFSELPRLTLFGNQPHRCTSHHKFGHIGCKDRTQEDP